VSGGPEQVDVLENGTGPGWWESVPRPARRIGAVVLVLVVALAGLLWIRDRAADRDRAERIDLVPSLAVETSSTSPPGGRVAYFVVVHNEGPGPVTVTSVTGGDAGLRLRTRDDDERTVPGGAEVSIPLSVRLTCADEDGAAGPLPVELTIRRPDGGLTSRDVELEPALLVRDVAATVCAVRPDLSDHELSGRVLRGVTAKDDAAG
jgi:hypothetical protein